MNVLNFLFALLSFGLSLCWAEQWAKSCLLQMEIDELKKQIANDQQKEKLKGGE